MRSDLAWSDPKIPKVVPDKKIINEVVPVSLDTQEVAHAISSHLVGPTQRSENDEKLIFILSIGISVLAVTSLLCALICIIVVALSSRTISKLELLLR